MVSEQIKCNIKKGKHRVDCGHSKITEEKCFNKGCCWSPLPKGEKGPWCYVSPSSKFSPFFTLKYGTVLDLYITIQRQLFVLIKIWQ